MVINDHHWVLARLVINRLSPSLTNPSVLIDEVPHQSHGLESMRHSITDKAG